MKKHVSLLIGVIALISSLLFMACPTGTTDPETTYQVITETDPSDGSGGTITASPDSGPAGTRITVTITSKDGYYLEEVFVDSASKGKTNPLTVTLGNKDITVKAVFKAIPANNFKITLKQPSTGGTISLTNGLEYASPGDTVSLSNAPADGYIFKEYTVMDADDGKVTVTGNSFAMPGKNVTVSGVFENLGNKDTDQLITAGKEALESGNISSAINAFESAYTKNPGNAEALVYSTVGKLASIAWSPEVGNFFKNRLGLKNYPSTMDALINPNSWFEYYPDKDRADGYYDSSVGRYVSWQSKDEYISWGGKAEDFEKTYPKGDGYYYYWGEYKFVSAQQKQGEDAYWYYDDNGNSVQWVAREDYFWLSDAEFAREYPDGSGYYYWDSGYTFVTSTPHYESSSMPPLNVPEWVKGKGIYTDSLTENGGASSSTWPIILTANLIDKNTTGLNPALDDVINAVFNNPNYTEAMNRIAALKENSTKAPVKMDVSIIQEFGLSEFFGDADVYVGWAELELLASALKLVKGTLLYVNSYNWSYDIGFVKDLPWDETILEEANIDTIAGNLNKVLPLRTGFLTDRGGSWMEDSRKAYGEAVASLIGVYDYYTGTDSNLPPGAKDLLKEYKDYRDEAEKARTAMNSKGTYTLEGDGMNITIDFGKLFNPGQLALDKLIETAGSGAAKSPAFYGVNGNGMPAKINSSGDLEKYRDGAIGFKITPRPLEEIIGEDLADFVLQETGLTDEDGYLLFDGEIGALAWAVYHWEAGGKGIITGFLNE
jgi:hypothetical protein